MIRSQLTSLGVKTLCDLALKTYKRLLDNDQWPAASSIPKLQSDALPAAFQALASDPIASAAYQAMAAELKLLRTQTKIPITGSGVVSPDAEYMANVTCYNCGKKGHARGQCPNKPTWKFIAPINGAPTTITKTDKTWYWCAKCVRWTTSHSTSTHVTKVKDPADSVKAEAKLASVSEQNQEEVMSDEDDDLIYNGFGMMAHCDDSYITWTPSSNHNNQDLINDKSNQNEHHLVDMKESDILIDTTMSEHLTLDTTAKDAETTPSKVFPVPLVTSCVQPSKLTSPLAASTCH